MYIIPLEISIYTLFYESQKISRNVKDLSQEVKVNHEETQL